MNWNGLRALNQTLDLQKVDAQVSASVDQTKRALVQQMATMLIVIGMLATLFALRLASLPDSTMLAALTGLGICAVSIVFVRSQLPVVVGASCLIASWLAALFVVAYLRGGIDAPLLIAVPIVPVIAATVISRRAAWIVLTFILIGVATLSGLELAGHEFPQSPAANPQFNIMRAIWMALSSLMATKLATYNIMRSETLTLQLQQLALTDALTGLANRRAILSVLETEMARAQRSKMPLAILLLDVDHFKAVNDTNGHLAGDRALARIAGAIVDGMRSGGDAVGRWGGEEFLVVLPDTTPQNAVQVAERVRGRVADLGIRYQPDKAKAITVTIGVAGCHETSATTSDELVNMADQALFRGKTQGRNRVTLADALLPTTK